MKAKSDSRLFILLLLGLWVLVELVYSSGWNRLRDVISGLHEHPPVRDRLNLSDILTQKAGPLGRPLRVWFAPYQTFPEPGFWESPLRNGVYDTFLAFPPNGIHTNYGAVKLSPADSLFALGSSFGIVGEYRLARLLGYSYFAIDIGALLHPQDGISFCSSAQKCIITSDGYALVGVRKDDSGVDRSLIPLARRMPLLPLRSAGPSMGVFVMPAFQWEVIGFAPQNLQSKSIPWLVVSPRIAQGLQVYRYPLSVFPRVSQPLLESGRSDVQLVLNPGVEGLRLCFRSGAESCKVLLLSSGVPRIEIGDLLKPGTISSIYVVSVSPPNMYQPLFTLRLRNPGAARFLSFTTGSATPGYTAGA